MAIYHNEVKIITRGTGRSACAASAYLSCSVIYNDYDGIQHDYTHKGGLVWEQVFLPPMAPEAWHDKEQLWNAVEAAEQSKESRLAREHIVALPLELDKEQWVSILTDYIQTQFVDEGMCVHVAIHDTDGHNPHAHIMTTVRPLNPDGTWQNKTEKEYLCIRNGEERGFTAAEFKEARNDGWEKQYPYLVGKKKVYMPMSEGEAHGYERTSKHPKNTRYGRQNPIVARWNSEEQLQKWRVAWEDIVNHQLERAGNEERIDHRSHAERGLDEHPTIHEGTAARIKEKKGGISERCELNRQIRKDNQEIRYWKAVIEKLKQAAVSVVDTITDIAKSIEINRQKLIANYYFLEHNDHSTESNEKYIAWVEPLLSEYMIRHDKLRNAIKARNELKDELDSISPVHVFKRKDLSNRIETLNGKIDKMKNKQAAVRDKCGKTTHAEMKELQTFVSELKTSIQKHPENRAKRVSAISIVIQTLRDLYARAKVFDLFALKAERKKIRATLDVKGKERIKEKINRNPNPELYKQCADKADEAISDLDIEFMPPENKKPSRNKEQQQARESQKSRAKQTKGPEMII